MRRQFLAFALAAATIAAFAVPSASAYEKYVALVPNGDAVPGIQALGHTDPQGGGMRNAFGKAFADAGHVWTQDLCNADTDGDGQTNGQELGDPCCTWANSGYLMYIKGISNPSNASDTVNKKQLKSITCVQTASQAAASAAHDTKTKKPKTTTSSSGSGTKKTAKKKSTSSSKSSEVSVMGTSTAAVLRPSMWSQAALWATLVYVAAHFL